MRAALLSASVGLTAVIPGTAFAQIQPAGPARLVSFINEPLEPQVGEVFELRLNVRLAPDVVAFFPDTLPQADVVVSAGRGTWEVTPAPADSIDVRLSYPTMGLALGGSELPTLEVWTRPATSGETPGPRSVSELASTDDLRMNVIPIGGVLVMPLREMIEAGESGMIPRPPADVIGGRWSVWMFAAIVVALATLGLLVRLWLSGRPPAGILASVVLSPRAEALGELDRLRELGWHTNGRVLEFYDATTGVLRHFAERTHEDWRTALTSTELLARLEDRWGTDRLAGLGTAVRTAERVKFGGERPAPDAAVGDWETVRRWIEELPER